MPATGLCWIAGAGGGSERDSDSSPVIRRRWERGVSRRLVGGGGKLEVDAVLLVDLLRGGEVEFVYRDLAQALSLNVKG